MSDAASPTVLVVDDSAPIAALVMGVLTQNGCSAIHARSADEAWKRIEGGLVFDGLITDVDMPGTLNGITLLEQLRRKEDAEGVKRRPAVVVSGNPHDKDGTSREDRARALDGEFLKKPFRLTVLSDVFIRLGLSAPPAAGRAGP